MLKEHFTTGERWALDALSITTVLGTLTNMLPAIAALVTIIWTGIRIWETDTVQKLFKRKVNDVKDPGTE